MKLPDIFEKEVEPLSVPAGKVIYSEGEKPTAMYIVKLGEVELKVRGTSLEVVGPDGFFGEGALADNGDRLATAVAKTDCVLIPKRKTFHFYDRGNPLLWADRNAQNGGTLATNIFARWIS